MTLFVYEVVIHTSTIHLLNWCSTSFQYPTKNPVNLIEEQFNLGQNTSFTGSVGPVGLHVGPNWYTSFFYYLGMQILVYLTHFKIFFLWDSEDILSKIVVE